MFNTGTNYMDNNGDKIFDVILFWDHSKEQDLYKQYCGETLCNILGYPPELSVKLVYEAMENNRTLILSTWNSDKAVEIRNKLIALDLDCKIRPTQTSCHR